MSRVATTNPEIRELISAIKETTGLLQDVLREIKSRDEARGNELLHEIVQNCKTNQEKLMQAIEQTQSEVTMNELLQQNDNLNRSLEMYEKLLKGQTPAEAPGPRRTTSAAAPRSNAPSSLDDFFGNAPVAPTVASTNVLGSAVKVPTLHPPPGQARALVGSGTRPAPAPPSADLLDLAAPSAAFPPGTLTVPKVQLSQSETLAYEGIWNQVSSQGSLGPAQAMHLFLTSGLSQHQLAEVWDLVDAGKKGHLTKDESMLAFRLIALAQQGQPPSTQSLVAAAAAPQMPVCQLQGFTQQPMPPADPFGFAHTPSSAIPVPAYNTSPALAPIMPPAPVIPPLTMSPPSTFMTSAPTPSPPAPAPYMDPFQGGGGGGGGGGGYGVAAVPSIPNTGLSNGPVGLIGDDQRNFYMQAFAEADTDRTGFISGAQAVSYFGRSGLHTQALAAIWALADMDRDSRLDVEEFIVAMHLINNAMAGQPVPTSLPTSLIPPVKYPHLAPAAPVPAPTASVQPLPSLYASQTSNLHSQYPYQPR